MTTKKTTTAATFIPYGSPIAVSKNRASITTPETMTAVAKRPHVTNNDRGYEPDEPIEIHTDGMIMVELPGGARMCLVKDGRVVA